MDALAYLLWGSKKMSGNRQHKRKLTPKDAPFRRVIESLSSERYRETGYYDKWAYAITVNMLEEGLITEAELGEQLGLLRAEPESQSFNVGDVVSSLRKVV